MYSSKRKDMKRHVLVSFLLNTITLEIIAFPIFLLDVNIYTYFFEKLIRRMYILFFTHKKYV